MDNVKGLTLFALTSLISLSANAQLITTIAGNGLSGLWGDGGLATIASVHNPHCITFDATGNMYYSDYNGCKVRKVGMDGIITTVAGTGLLGFSGDGGMATSASLKYPEGLAVDAEGNLYIADCQNYRIRKINAVTGIITTFAGSGVIGDEGDGGGATSAKFFPKDICFDKKGNLLISDNTYGKIRKVAASGIITTIAGNGTCTFSGDGGAATSAGLCNPTHICVDDTGNIYIADGLNKRIRKVDTFGVITTVAGTGVALYNGDAIPATAANIGPLGVVWFNNALYITDSNHRVRKVNESGIISTIAGIGTNGYSGDGGPATSAQLSTLGGIAAGECGDIFFSDILNYRIRKVTMPPVLTIPTISVAVPGESGPIPTGTTVTVTAAVSNAGSSYLIRWMNRGIEFATTTVPTVTYTKGPGTDTITAKVVSTATYGCYDSTTSAPHYVHEGTVGVPYLQTAGVTVYPNPVQEALTISTTEPITSVCITNVLGQVVQVAPPGLPQGEVTAPPILPRGEVTVPVGHLPKGVYVVRVNGLYVQRLVKE